MAVPIWHRSDEHIQTARSHPTLKYNAECYTLKVKQESCHYAYFQEWLVRTLFAQGTNQ